ncbi:MAG: hypothetical protein JSU74_12490 [Candidatus Zixiibacteriota bacterium]|nr:MAG: hypothetical protein JSU74_12490 [candidate division Zixibacteria bacterium]
MALEEKLKGVLKRIVLLCAFSSGVILFAGSAASYDFAGTTIRVYIDSAASDANVLSSYLSDDVRDSFLENVAQGVKDGIEGSLSSQEIDFPVYLPEIEDESAIDTLYPDHSVTLIFRFDGRGLLTVQATLNKSEFSETIEDTEIPIFTASAISANKDPRRAADLIARELVPVITRWIVDSLYKVRVIIDDFVAEDPDESNRFLTSGLANMVRTELTCSQAFIVYAGRPSDSQEAEKQPPTFANYILSGSFFSYQGGIRVDILCKNTESQRILLSQSIVLDTLSLHVLSDRVAQASSRMKSAILADFQRSQIIIAVVVSSPRRYFVGHSGLDDLRDVARIFRHNMVNKLRTLVRPRGSPTSNVRVQVMEDTERFDRFIDSSFAPGEILSELSADYLVLVGIEDIGEGIRAVSTLYSYVTDPPIMGEPIHDGSQNKAKFDYLLDETILSLFSRFCELGVVPDSSACLSGPERERIISGEASSAEISAGISLLKNRMEGARVQDIRPNKGIGIRPGVITHGDERLFLGRKSAEYLELFYSVRLPDIRRFPSWLATEIELSFGLEFGQGTILRDRTTATNAMLTGRALFTALQYSNLPLLVGVGIGLGYGRISHKYEVGEAPYAGECRLQDGESRGLLAVSGKLEVPVTNWLRLQIVPRYVFQMGPEISCFETAPFDNTVVLPPRGKLTTWTILAGLQFVMR